MAKIVMRVDEAYKLRERKERLRQIRKKQEERFQQRQVLLNALANKRSRGKLTLEDIFEQQRIIIEMLQEILEQRSTQ